ncbi:MAG TPA: MFS transporter [Solirubrobacterales bacterium]
MSREARRRLILLGLPTFGMALAVTAVATYLPVVARGERASTTSIGLIIGTEGLLALWLPILVGSWSDRLRTPLGRRLPFVLAGTPVMVASLCAAGFVGSVLGLGILVAVFFAGYFVAYEPYRALYPDLLPDEVAGRSQSAQAGWRGLGTGVALLSGGALLSVSVFLPFCLYAGLLALSVALFTVLLLRWQCPEPGAPETAAPSARRAFGQVASLLREHPALRVFLLANALWELALGATKTFVVLYVTAGLGYSLGQASLIIGGVALLVLAGALVSGRLADRHGRLRVTEVGLWVYGLSMLVPGVTTLPAAVLVAVPLVALGGGMLMSLPYSLLMPLMPEGAHGAMTGLYSLSRGLGVMFGPLLAGLAIEAGHSLFASTQGYAATWWVAGLAILLSILPLRRLRGEREDRRELGGDEARRESSPLPE